MHHIRHEGAITPTCTPPLKYPKVTLQYSNIARTEWGKKAQISFISIHMENAISQHTAKFLQDMKPVKTNVGN